KPVFREECEHLVWEMALSPDGKSLWLGDESGRACARDTTSMKCTAGFFPHSQRVCAIAFSPGGQRMVTGSMDRTAKLWTVGAKQKRAPSAPYGEVSTGEVQITGPLHVFRGHFNDVLDLAFVDQARQVVTSADWTIRLFDTDHDGDAQV